MKRVCGMKAFKSLRPATLKVLAERKFHDPRKDKYGAVAPPERGRTGKIYTSIAYTFRSAAEAAAVFEGTKEGYAYPRISRGTPPIQELTKKLLQLELGKDFHNMDDYDVLLTASGMSATVLLALTLADRGGEFISSPYLYGGTYHLFTEFIPRLDIACHMIKDPFNLNEWKRAAELYPHSKFIFAEDDANPTPRKLQNRAIADIAHYHNMLYVCDRTIGTPILERPLLSGTDVVVHSASKNIGGRSAGLGGAIIARKDIIQKIRDGWFAVIGPVMDPRVADYMLFGLRDLEKRMRQKVENAKIIAEFLKKHPRVKKLYGPGGDLLAFEIRGGLEDARRVVESYRLILFAPHLGDIRTLSIHPASTTHSKVPAEERMKLGISDTLIRLSVGLEDPRDIIDDLARALAKIESP